MTMQAGDVTMVTWHTKAIVLLPGAGIVTVATRSNSAPLTPCMPTHPARPTCQTKNTQNPDDSHEK